MTESRKRLVVFIVGAGLLLVFFFILCQTTYAQGKGEIPEIKLPDITIGTQKAKDPESMLMPYQMLFLLTILSLAPYILIMTTSFIRVTIVLSFLRTAMGTQQVPPTQVLMGLALFMTFFIMMPVGKEINEKAIRPFTKKEISWDQFLNRSSVPIRNFMFKNVRDKDLLLFVKMAKIKKVKKKEQIPTWVLVPAFIVSEITTSFEIGFLIYLPFLVVDMVVACVLMSMGMFMLSPMSISMPFKLLLFVMVDGWELVVESLLRSFR